MFKRPRLGQQAIFFITSFVLYFTGNGLYPLLPGLAAGFGATATVTGLFLAALSAANAVGLLLAGRLMSRVAPRTLYVGVGALGVPALLILALAPSLGVIIAATAFVWFVGGFLMTIFNVLTGLSVAPEARGRAFTLLYLSSPLAAIFGGGFLGALINSLGYTPGFAALALMWAAIPLLGLRLPSAPPLAPAPVPSASTPASVDLGPSFTLLLVSALVISAAIGLRNVAAYLQMAAAGFSPAAIGATTVVAGLAAIPVALFSARIADRVGRRTLLIAMLLLLILALIPLTAATLLWQYAAGIALLMVATVIVRPVVNAIATDLLPAAALQRGLPLIEAGMMGVGIVSSAIAGYLLQHLGAIGVTTATVALLLVGATTTTLLCSARLVGAACPAPVRRLAFWS